MAIPVAPPVNPHPTTTRAKQGFRLSANRLTLLATSVLALSSVPSSIHTTIINLYWWRAMEEEFTALITNNTWDLVPRPIGSKIVTDKWIFKHKFNSNGSLEWYKVCWVLCGFT
jgi:hypothetical protein